MLKLSPPQTHLLPQLLYDGDYPEGRLSDETAPVNPTYEYITHILKITAAKTLTSQTHKSV